MSEKGLPGGENRGEELLFPDSTQVSDWFFETRVPDLAELGRQYVLTQYQIRGDGKIYTKEIQALIDLAAEQGGGVIVVPAGTYMTGSLFFRQGVHLYIAKDGVLKGSDDISDYALCETRIEGESCLYFAALINADGVDGFTMCGPGTIDGNGARSWRAFWLRRTWNPNCTNKDEQRPRLVYLSNSKNVTIAGLKLQNSHFWTTHLYRCDHVRYLNCRIYSPAAPVKAPSTDAIDIDVCTDILIKNCYIEVNDDAVVLKGGKGPGADQAPENGANERILIEDCTFGFCHACLTCGSESIHDRNVIMRRSHVLESMNFLRFKMRPDTPQLYEYITVKQAYGKVDSFINIHPWYQFADKRECADIPKSLVRKIAVRDCSFDCKTYFDVQKQEDSYQLTGFILENLTITAETDGFSEELVENIKTENVHVTVTQPTERSQK